ncbi:sorting nexin-19 isoform X3 [Homo sapiens]|uniref:sorting nexin-19 isoform X3 n=1 Tax=Homo sapiens TaxID=9606 RepID=UPI001FB192C4|nr:sorting nexin-19 isoform X3 [Homo sapiens]
MKTETVPPFQETPAGSSCHLNNLLSSRKLMAVGVLLGWLLVIHLLVNVWLLCLLSALLVVLGGWLGSSLAGVASGRLHLERFIPLATCPPCPEAERQLEREINRTIQMIIRDFVLSWYRSVSQEPAFEEEMEAAMKGLVQELRRRMSVMDSHAVAQSVLTLCGCHLQSYIQAKEATAGKNGPVEPSHLWEAYCRATAPHPAVHSPSAEVTYTRGVVNLLLQGLVPKPHLETRTGRHVVVELITCNVILPLISRLSDPDWIHLVLYETALDGENSSGLQQLAYHTVNRRYREFLNLQTRLEEKPDLRKFIKNVKGPKKLFPDLPLGNMDSDRVEARKSLLESFLKQLCAIPEIANSEEVQEFLALNTDARIAFVKKPFMVSRIDKMVVSAIVDTLKTAFPRSEPQSPTEELSEAETESKPQTEGKKASKSRLRFSSSKISPALSVTEAQDKILYCLQEGNVESETLSMSAMESFIEKQTKLLEMQPTKAPEKDPEQPPKGRVDSCVSDAAVPAQDPSNSDPGTETELADTALDLLLLLLTEQWKWLCTENMQKFLRLIFGTLVQRVLGFCRSASEANLEAQGKLSGP